MNTTNSLIIAKKNLNDQKIFCSKNGEKKKHSNVPLAKNNNNPCTSYCVTLYNIYKYTICFKGLINPGMGIF